MPLSRTVREIMVPLAEYPFIRVNDRFIDAFRAIHEGYRSGRRFRHVLVLNEQDQLVGLLGLRDILHGLFPDYLRSRELHHHAEGPTPDFPALTLIWADTCATQCPEAAKKPIGEFMAAVPARLKADDPITKAAYLMVIHDTSMLPVVEDTRLVGVARVIDVFNEAAETVLHD